MSNRKKPKSEASVVVVPTSEKVVVSKVPANIHWSQVPGVPREDTEVVGEAIIYEDGTSDVVINDDISLEARELIYNFQADMLAYSLPEE